MKDVVDLSPMSHEVLEFSFMGKAFCMDHAVVHISREDASFNLGSEFCVNHGLECGWRISHPEEHNEWFE
jgi:hypothetical protein